MQIPLIEKAPRGACGRCEIWPEPLRGPGTLHIRLPLGHSLGKFLGFLRGSHFVFESHDEGVLSVQIEDEDLSELGLALSRVLTPSEAVDTRVVFQKVGEEFELKTLLEVESLANFSGRAQMAWLLELVEQGRLTSFFHPILNAQSGEVFAFEALARGFDTQNQLVSPAQLFGVARDAGFLFQLDLATRRSAIRQAAIHGVRSKVFVNFTPTAIYDPQYCLRSTISLVREVGLQPSQVVFEVVESDHVNDVGHLNGILDVYRASGFQVALDDIGAGYSSLTLLSKLQPDYVKIDRELVSGVCHDRFKAVIAAKLIETAQELGLKVVAEGVETERELEWLQLNGADFVQGFLFGKPAPKPEKGFWPENTPPE